MRDRDRQRQLFAQRRALRETAKRVQRCGGGESHLRDLRARLSTTGRQLVMMGRRQP